MKRFIFLFIIWIIMGMSMSAHAQNASEVHVVPKPVSVQVFDGHFQLNSQTAVVVKSPGAKGVGQMLVDNLDRPTGFQLSVVKNKSISTNNSIILKLYKTPDEQLDSAGYTLLVSPQRVVIAANKPRGLFYGMQTLMQLLPPDIESKTAVHSVKWQIPCVKIWDYPRFGWRGLMLDVSRHFFPKGFVEQYIDEMAKYKFNVFHWHLTDDQGWRIQIKGLPMLTDVGAWRVPRTGEWRSYAPPQPGEKATDGGYYTQEDIREVVAYAKKRFVTIVPEIDVPAHSLALIASYPDLSCTKKQYQVNPGSKSQGEDNVLCVANDSTWLVLDKIFTQVARLFPGPYIHVGGDEANKKFWMKDPKDLRLMKRKGLNNPAALQSYFEKKLRKIILSKGKKMIGWDEIMEGGLARATTVMSWRGMNRGIQAAKMGHHVIMTPIWDTYLSRCQGNPYVEPAAPGNLRLHACYQFDPIPDSVKSKNTIENIMGGEGCLWTEFVPNFRHAEYMTWPRAMALSEVFWSPKRKRDWVDFVRRIEQQFKYLKAAQVKYAPSIYDPVITTLKGNNGSPKIKLTTEIPGLDIYYRFDGTNPDNFSPKYEGKPLSIPEGASQIRIITYKNGKPIGRQVNCPLSYLKEKLKKNR